ncbi:MAG: hypothetical protein R3293_23400, partial [Candidatus Promineifilaceae bacterium]|nr:hypothetical protein [Candidatus Promineifilaceae bacterium]
MTQEEQSNSPPYRLADRLAAARRGRFVGREFELTLFRSALLADEAPFVVLHIYGPGGVGKTTLLQEYARLAEQVGRTAVLLDGRNFDISPAGFQQAWQMALAQTGSQAAISPDPILLIDTYEMLGPLDNWLRTEFLPQLPPDVLVVLAGRRTPASAWRIEPGWSDLTHIVPLRNLRPEESQTYLTARGIPADQHETLLAITHGHPLALSLVADVLNQGDRLTGFNLQTEPDIVRLLLERFTRNVPDAQHRQALEICAHLRVTSEALLAHLLGKEAAFTLFSWLSSLSFIQQGARGLFPHDLARDVLDADFRWRNPQAYETLHHEARRYYEQELAKGADPALSADLLYLLRYYAAVNPYFEWEILNQAYMERATPADHPFILQQVQQYEGDESVEIARYWLQKRPQAFIMFRTAQERQFGFVAVLMLTTITAEDTAVDPAMAAAATFMQQHMPLRPQQLINCIRFWMGRDSYQDTGMQTLVALSSSATWLSHNNMAWTLACTARPEHWQKMFTHFNFEYTGKADFTVGGHRYGVFTHNWQAEPVGQWLEWLGAQHFRHGMELERETAVSASPPLLTLSQPEFIAAVRQALRDYTRPDLLANSPLMRSRLLLEPGNPTASALQTLIQEAAHSLTANPKDEKFYSA